LPANCWRQIFANDRPVAVEIGPGRGEFLISNALAEPQRNFFAIEHSSSRTREIAARLERQQIANARVVCGDAVCLIELFPERSVTAFFVLFPDPWWKRRHHKRRLWTPRFVAALRRALVSGGTIEMMTDVADYFAVAQRCLAGDAELELVAVDEPTAVPTSFARKAIARGDPLRRSIHLRRN
jgi:tRNA (guanine-N7-)-methyltransferase